MAPARGNSPTPPRGRTRLGTCEDPKRPLSAGLRSGCGGADELIAECAQGGSNRRGDAGGAGSLGNLAATGGVGRGGGSMPFSCESSGPRAATRGAAAGAVGSENSPTRAAWAECGSKAACELNWIASPVEAFNVQRCHLF